MSAPPVLQVRRLPNADGLPLPAFATSGSSGLDLRAAITEPLVLQPGARSLTPTGLAVAVPPGYEVQVRPRSGLALKHGLSMVNTPGTVDSDYRGELSVILINLGSEPIRIERGDRIAQMVVCPVVQPLIEEVAELPPTDRGAGGFGHTGR